MPAQSSRILAQISPHLLHLPKHEPRMVQHRTAGNRRVDAARVALEQPHARGFLHAADARARGGKRQPGPFGAAGNALGFHDETEKAQISEVEAHHARSL